MPVYGVKVRGADETRIVRASSAAKARDHIVEAKALNGEEVADAVEKGAKIETASEGDPEPAPAGDPPASEKPTEDGSKSK